MTKTFAYWAIDMYLDGWIAVENLGLLHRDISTFFFFFAQVVSPTTRPTFSEAVGGADWIYQWWAPLHIPKTIEANSTLLKWSSKTVH